ncbi:MAG: putative hydrolase superfamily [Ilumatobacteraceae bacterium]|nr:putative hydrolase superfamily [Ilumatobacteraceae bacterium]
MSAIPPHDGAPLEGAPIEAVFFDFAGTLFDDRDLRDVHLRQLRFVAAAVGVEASDDELRTAYRQGMAIGYRAVALQPAYLHRALFGAAFSGMATVLGGSIDHATEQAAVDRQYAATIDAVRLRPDCLDTLAALRAHGIHVQIVSNIDDEQLQPLVARLGLAAVIDAATSSESAGSCKPDAAIYRLALATAGVDAEHALFVGDSTGHDIVGPAAMGMRTAWLAPRPGADPGDARPDAVIGSLGEVLQLVGLGASR